MLRWLRNKKGQGMLEWLLIIAAVTGAILVAAKVIKGKLDTGLTKAATKMEQALSDAFGG